MKKKATWIVLALVLVGVLIGAGALYNKLTAGPVPETTAETVPQTEAEPTAGPQTQTEPFVQTQVQETVTVPQTEAAEKKAAAPDFTVLDADGRETSLSSHFGKPLVVNFWATWCGPCRNELPGFDKAAKAYAGRIDFMMVNLTDGYRDTVDGVKAFVEENGYSFPVYFDTQDSASAAYGIYSIPVTLFIDADGSVRQSYTGSMSEDVLNGFLEELVS